MTDAKAASKRVTQARDAVKAAQYELNWAITDLQGALAEAKAESERLKLELAGEIMENHALKGNAEDNHAEIERLRAALEEIAGGHVEGRPGIPNDAWFQIVARAALAGGVT